MATQEDIDKLTRALAKEREAHRVTRGKLSTARTEVTARAIHGVLTRALDDLRALT